MEKLNFNKGIVEKSKKKARLLFILNYVAILLLSISVILFTISMNQKPTTLNLVLSILSIVFIIIWAFFKGGARLVQYKKRL